jgi:thiol-disulfide isomerase/thioredoxin
MKMLFHATILMSVLSVVFCPLCGCASDSIAEPPAIGSVLTNFELKDVNGATHTLEQYRGKIVVVEMCSLNCPFSRGADPHLVELSKKYADQAVFIGIDSNKSTTVEDIKKYTEEKGKAYPVLKDEDNKYADAIGAKVTPEVYVVDKEGKLVYHGAFDDRANPEEKGKNAYVDNAIATTLAGKTVEPNEVKSWGCSIKRK